MSDDITCVMSFIASNDLVDLAAKSPSIPKARQGAAMANRCGRLIAIHKELELELYADFGTDNQLFGNVIRVRSQGNGSNVFSFDEYSNHYCLMHQSNPIGTLTTTRQARGNVDCHEFYPLAVLTQFHEAIASCCKFRINASSCSNRLAAMRFMARESWGDLIEQGVRLDLINARRELASFYMRMGYTIVNGSDFVHPILGTDSLVLFLPVDPSIPSSFQYGFARVTDVLYKSQVLHIIDTSNQVA